MTTVPETTTSTSTATTVPEATTSTSTTTTVPETTTSTSTTTTQLETTTSTSTTTTMPETTTSTSTASTAPETTTSTSTTTTVPKTTTSSSTTTTDSETTTSSSWPSSQPSGHPSSQPTISSQPSSVPSREPSNNPSPLPSVSNLPSSQPSSLPSLEPSAGPSSWPSSQPSGQPSIQPTISSQPSSVPSSEPTNVPSLLPSNEPSKSSMPSTSSQPSTSSRPSLTPKFRVSVAGSLSVSIDPCTLSDAAYVTYLAGIVETIEKQMGYGQAEITETNCNNPGATRTVQRNPTAQVNSRHLQETGTSWQISFNLIITDVLCGSAGCTDGQDIEDINALIESVSNELRSSLQSGDFIAALAENPNVVAALGSDLVKCLVAWGVVNAPIWGGINTDDATVVQTQGPVSTNTTKQFKFYPDWNGNSGSCKNDGLEPLYMSLNPATWLYDSLEACCTRYYSGWNEPKCLHSAGTGLWHVDYSLERCVTDCGEEGAGATCGDGPAPISTQLYGDPRECCKAQLAWVYIEFCENESLMNNCYAGTGKFYDGNHDDGWCVRDCDPAADGDTTCGGIVDATWVRLYDPAEGCCAAEFDWIENELCAVRSRGTVSDKYWPDQDNSKCVKDSVTPATDLDVPLFDTAEACCTARIGWEALPNCIADAEGVPAQGTGKFYIDWVLEMCVKDCEVGTGSGCGGIAEKFEELHESASSCCDEIPWIDRNDCLLF
ncbi:hypothetical protein ACHAXR_003615 [Thalassiosira sp. AJA248-18]